jgi:hypothetical protein
MPEFLRSFVVIFYTFLLFFVSFDKVKPVAVYKPQALDSTDAMDVKEEVISVHFRITIRNDEKSVWLQYFLTAA